MKLYSYKSFLVIFSLLVVFISCKKEYETIEESDSKAILTYIQQNKLDMQEYNNSGIYFKILKQGTGVDLKYTDIVPVIFTVRSLDGRYSSVDTFAVSNRYGSTGTFYTFQGAEIPPDFLGYFGPEKRYPEGLRIAAVEILKKRGGEIRVIIPSRKAYGKSGLGDIPGNTSLDYTIKVLDETKLTSYEDISIRKYMQANNLNVSEFTKAPSGVYYKILEMGNGSNITVDSIITVSYAGKLFNGQIFDQKTDETKVSFALSGVIPAWQEVIPKIKEGGRVRLITPSSSAYGLRGSRNENGQMLIPVASSLDFEVKVIEVAKGSG